MLKKLLNWALKKKASDEGLTLIELLAVIVILAIIAAIAIPIILVSVNNAKISTTQQDLSIIANALNRYYLDNNGYPLASSGSTSIPSELAPKYLASIPTDGWNQNFSYAVSNAGTSSAPDYVVYTKDPGSSTYYYITNSSSVSEASTVPSAP